MMTSTFQRQEEDQELEEDEEAEDVAVHDQSEGLTITDQDPEMEIEASTVATKVQLGQVVIKDSEETQEIAESDLTLQIELMMTSTLDHQIEDEEAEEEAEVHQICTKVHHDTTIMDHPMDTNTNTTILDHTLRKDTEAMIPNLLCTLKAMEADHMVVHQETTEENLTMNNILPLEVEEMEEDIQNNQVAHHQDMDRDLTLMKEVLAQEALTHLK